jgi:hypothetical protein
VHCINYHYLSWGSASSGGGIFDARVIGALQAEAEVRECAVPTSRKWTLPIWDKRIEESSRPDAGDINVVSHEFLHAIVETHQVDCFIIHNYFAEFDFDKLRFINPLYRLGSEAIYAKIFAGSRKVIFLSAREMRLAAESHPEFAGKFSFCPPGHNDRSSFHGRERDPHVVEMPGTIDWLPKKLSFWMNMRPGLPVEGKLVQAEVEDAYISLVFDSFVSGFKLKLVEMAKHAKSIVSFCDLEEDLSSIGYRDLPYIAVRNRAELRQAITSLREKGDLSLEDRMELYRRASAWTWGRMARTVLDD